MARHSLAPALRSSPGPLLACLLLPRRHCSSFHWEKLYFHCRAMKCLCMTAERTTINLTPAELTGQKPMQPLLGTEHYQCMDSLFIRGSIRHRSPRCRTGYETDGQQVNAGLQWNTVEDSCTWHDCILCSGNTRGLAFQALFRWSETFRCKCVWGTTIFIFRVKRRIIWAPSQQIRS